MSIAFRRLLIILLGLLAGVAVWPVAEALLFWQGAFPSYLLFSVALGVAFGVVVGALLGSGEGIATSVPTRIWSGVAIGSVVGAVGGVAGFLVGQAVLFALSAALAGGRGEFDRVALPAARIVGWALVGLFVGQVEGVRARSGRKLVVGALGGLVGGAAGGLVLELAWRQLPEFAAARLLALTAFGGLLAGSLALIESRLASGRLRILNGPLNGKEFLVSQRRLNIGSGKSNAVCLASYAGVLAHHAELRIRQGTPWLHAKDTAAPVLLNDQRVVERELKYEDVIQVGSAKLFYRYG